MSTVIELGKLVKTKYPGQYDDLSDMEVGRKVKQKYPGKYADFIDAPEAPKQRKPSAEILPGQKLGQGLATAYRQVTGQNKEGDRIGESVRNSLDLIKAAQKLPVGSPERKRLLVMAQNQDYTPESEVDPGTALTNREVLGSAGNLALTYAGARLPVAGSFGGRLAQTGAYGAGANVLAGVQDGTELQNLPGKALAGALTGVGLQAGLEGVARTASAGFPRLLSYISRVPKGAIERSMTRPSQVGSALKAVKGTDGERTLKTAQDATVQLRRQLSNDYGSAVEYFKGRFSGKILDLDEPTVKLLKTASREFGLDIPETTILEVDDALALNAKINALASSHGVKTSAKGEFMRRLKQNYYKQLIDTFGGPDGEVSQLLKNYSVEKQVFDAAEILTEPFDKANPKAQSRALTALHSAFKQNKSSYFQAIEQLEQKTGVNLLDEIAALEFSGIGPKQIGDFGFGELWRSLLIPLSSPRMVGFETRSLGRLINVAKKTGMEQPLKVLLLELLSGGDQKPTPTETQ